MHQLNTKQAIIQYIKSYSVPHILIDQIHPAILFSKEKNSWVWSHSYLLALSIKKLVNLCEYMEQFNHIKN